MKIEVKLKRNEQYQGKLNNIRLEGQRKTEEKREEHKTVKTIENMKKRNT